MSRHNMKLAAGVLTTWGRGNHQGCKLGGVRSQLRREVTNAAGRRGVRRGLWGVRCLSDDIFFKPARNCGGHHERNPVDSELQRRVAKLEREKIDVVRSYVSDDAANAIDSTISRLGGGISQMGLQVTIKAEYTKISSMLMSSLCTGYGLRSVESRMQLEKVHEAEDNRIDEIDESSTLKDKCEDGDGVGGNRLLQFLAKMCPESSLEFALSSSPQVMEAITFIVRQQMQTFGAKEPETFGFWGALKDPEVEMSQKTFLEAIEWCMVVGYFIHCEEYRISLESCMKCAEQDQNGQEQAQDQKRPHEQKQGLIQRLGGIFKWLHLKR